MKVVTCLLIVLISHVSSSKVAPINYDVSIKLEPDAFFTDTFYGQVNISLEVLEETEEIAIHAKDLLFVNLVLMDKIGNIYNLENNKTLFNDILLIQSGEKLMCGIYYLIANYNSTFSLHGLYKHVYKNQRGGTEFLVMKQGERSVFPCFAEPEIRANFDLFLTYPVGWEALANTLERNNTVFLNGNLANVRFKTTPLISTSTLSFIISNFTCDIDDKEVLYRICSRLEFQNERIYTLNAIYNILKHMEEFTEIFYNIHDNSKVDVVLIPDFVDTNAPNWGLYIFDEGRVLWNETSSSNMHKQQVMISMAHKLSEIWFGNFVYGEVDSFLATYFGYFAAITIQPTWELEQQFVVEQVQFALMEDSSGIFQSIYAETETVQVSQLVSSKGASIIRMISHIMGFQNFKKALHYYLKIHMFNGSQASDFWACLEKFSISTYNIENFVESWVHERGYPVLNVTRNGTDIVITQAPVKTILKPLAHRKNKEKWYIPISYTASKQLEFDTIPRVWLTPYDEETVIKNVITDNYDWIVLNNFQTGYYRVFYDEDLLNRISLALRNKDINAINRAYIIDDLFNLARVGYVSYSTVLNTLEFLGNDTDYYTWHAAFRGFDTIIASIKSVDTKEKITNHITRLMMQLYNSVPFYKENVDNHIYTLKQVLTLTWACKLEDPTCVNTSMKYFSDYEKGLEVPKNLKQVIYCTSLRHSKYIESDWLFLWNKFEEAKSFEQVTILEALSCVSKETILNRYLQLLFDSHSEVRKQDITKVLSAIIRNSPIGVNVVLQYLVHNYETVENYTDENTVKSLIYFLGNAITEQLQLNYLSKLVRSKSLSLDLEAFIGRVFELAVNNLNFVTNLEDELAQYFAEKTTTSLTTIVALTELPEVSTTASSVTVPSSVTVHTSVDLIEPTVDFVYVTVPSSSRRNVISHLIFLLLFYFVIMF